MDIALLYLLYKSLDLSLRKRFIPIILCNVAFIPRATKQCLISLIYDSVSLVLIISVNIIQLTLFANYRFSRTGYLTLAYN